jgi:NADPH:quinone reductase
MRAVQFRSYGPPEVLEVVDLPDPEPGAGQVLIRVQHAGVNFAEVMFRRGQFPVGVPHVPGLEAVGTVEAVGADVTTCRPGDVVAALTLAGGGNAELVVAPQDTVVVLDGALAGLAPQEAAAAICNVTTAWGLLEAARVEPGDSVLVLAAAGGVGSAAAQLARSRKAGYVFGAVGDATKLDPARAWGYDDVLTYDDLADAARERRPDGFDVVLDSIGGAVRTAVLPLTAFGGRHVIYGDAADQEVTVATNSVWFGGTSLVGYNLGGLAGAAAKVLGSHLRSALVAVREGSVRLQITSLPLANVAKAHAALESRASTGKFVLDVRGRS